MPDVSTNLASEIGHGREDAAREQVAFDLGEPEFDLVEPRRIRRGEMKVDVRMFQEERAHGLGLVRRQVVGNHMDRAPLRLPSHDLAEKVDKGCAGVSRHRVLVLKAA